MQCVGSEEHSAASDPSARLWSVAANNLSSHKNMIPEIEGVVYMNRSLFYNRTRVANSIKCHFIRPLTLMHHGIEKTLLTT